MTINSIYQWETITSLWNLYKASNANTDKLIVYFSNISTFVGVSATQFQMTLISWVLRFLTRLSQSVCPIRSPGPFPHLRNTGLNRFTFTSTTNCRRPRHMKWWTNFTAARNEHIANSVTENKLASKTFSAKKSREARKNMLQQQKRPL